MIMDLVHGTTNVDVSKFCPIKYCDYGQYIV